MRCSSSREVSSKRRSSSSEFGLRLLLFLSIILQELADVTYFAANVEEHTEDSNDILPLDDRLTAGRPHRGNLRPTA